MTHLLGKKALIAATVPLGLLMSQGVMAQQVETVTFTSRTTDSTETKTLPGNPCDIDQELIRVDIQATAAGRSSYSVTNLSDTSPSSVTVSQELVELSVTVPILPGTSDALIDASNPAVVTAVTLDPNEIETVDPVYTISRPPPSNTRTYTSAADLAVFDVATFDVNFVGDAEDSCSFSTGNSNCLITTTVEGSATVTYYCEDLEPELVCRSKTMSPTQLSSPSGQIAASFVIENTGPVDINGNLSITDTMNPKMTYNFPLSPTSDPAGIGDPTDTPPAYQWTGLSLAQGQQIQFSYVADVAGLLEGESICNTVVASANGTTSNACRVCLNRPPEERDVPAIGPLGLMFLTMSLGGLGALVMRFRRRRSAR